ncbi:MAG TPA: hypothetical protein IAD42_04135 [Candidatus Scatomorpha pullistercoris]|uniref:Uncharacterized protein n=1 Tax=Candidatus Scatomorpha pullistercoris TaxID=2840929 RepID=A0A9D1G5P0_9FIRM|nr:hypothetical protein [Candidatus Scatomorpha pullistercoris]
MTTVESVFKAAMVLMDELSSTGEARTSDTKEYELRAPSILNALTAELRTLMGETADWLPAEGMDDSLPVDTNYGLAAMPYGLAANLLVDENPSAASFFQQRYEELRAVYLARRRADIDDIEMLYGGIGHGEFARW